MNFFASNIRVLRKQNGLRQSEIQDRLGITRTTWSNYENSISQPSIDGLISIARFFSVSVSDLLEKEMEPVFEKQSPRKTRYRSLLKVSPLRPASTGAKSIGMWERTATW